MTDWSSFTIWFSIIFTGVTGDDISANGVDSTGSDDDKNNKKKPVPLNLEIPDCVTKLEDTRGGGKYQCNPCNAHCNSEQQLAQVRTYFFKYSI